MSPTRNKSKLNQQDQPNLEDNYHNRVNILSVVFLCMILLISARLVQLQVFKKDEYVAKANAQQSRRFVIPAKRGHIYVQDRSGIFPIAINNSQTILAADPEVIKDPTKTAENLASILGVDQEELYAKINTQTRYIEISSNLTEAQAEDIKKLKNAGLIVTQKPVRYYPDDNLFSHISGYVNSDGQGQYGIEQFANDELAGKDGQMLATTDSLGVPIASGGSEQTKPQHGQSYILTIDRYVQSVAHEALAEAVENNKAVSGSIIVLDPKTGAIRAMVSYPDYDPNKYQEAAKDGVDEFINSATSSTFEPGSGFKAITMAAGLNSGAIKPNTTYNDTGEVTIDDRTVRNAENHKYGNSTMVDVIQKSLNTGVVFILKKLGGSDTINSKGKQVLHEYIEKFGFGKLTGVEQMGEVAGKVRSADAYNVEYANMTFGQGLSVTSLQLANAFAAIANGGTLYKPHIIDKTIGADGIEIDQEPEKMSENIISTQTSEQLGTMLESVVEKGSGWATRTKGYSIGGKTGTAQVPRTDGKGYDESKNIGSFVGYAPVEDPQFVVLVRIDYPKVPGFAEKTAVPAFAKVTRELFKYYGVPPQP